MRKYTIALLFLLLAPVCLFAQSGTIRGQIIDNETGEGLIGATVMVEGTTIGSTTDMDGRYSLKVEPGTHSLRISYVSYQSQTIKDIQVSEKGVVVIDARLRTDDVMLEEFVVEAEAMKKTEAALLTVQRKASLVMDAISAEQFSRSGDSDAASAMKRVTGISVEGGKYVYVRGLGDRYSKTSVNKAQIPGLDPNKNSVQMDLFPSNLIDNIVVYKTFSPELPGSFSGGYVDISTKDFPSQFTMQLSGSMGFNSNASFNSNFLTQDLQSGYFLGLSPTERQLPGILQGNVVAVSDAISNDKLALKLDEQTKSLSGDFTHETKAPFLDQNLSFSLGNQYHVLGKRLGFIGGLSYQRSYEYYNDGKIGRYFLPGNIQEETELGSYYSLNDERAVESVFWGGILNTALMLNNYHKIRLNLMRNQSADISTRYSEGKFPFAFGSNDNLLQLRAQEYQVRSLSSGQLSGEHRFGGSNNGLKAEWLGAYTLSTQSQPDLRFFNNIQEIVRGDTTYKANDNNVIPPSHYFREMEEVNIEGKVDFELPVRVFNDLASKIQFGGSFLSRKRDFQERIFQYRVQNGTKRFDGNPDEYFDEENLGLLGKTGSVNQFGLILRDETISGGSYNGDEILPAAYFLFDFQANSALKLSMGARYEGTNINLINQSEVIADSLREGNVTANDILPALNLTYAVKDNMNLRFGYGRTVARPNFRELARFATFDFLGDFLLVGNPNLERTLIDNIDLRWEVYPKPSEYLSVSAFYKKFQDPIERAVNPNTTDLAVLINFRNVGQATVYGLEFEARKDLSFIDEAMEKFNLGANLTFLQSAVDITEGELRLIRTNNPDAKNTRAMSGQAPYIINTYISYENPDSRLNTSLSYNVSGPRLSVVGLNGTPNVFEQARPMLDFNVKKGLGERWSVKASAKNLLNSAFHMSQEFKGKEYDYYSYKTGRDFSLSFSYLIE